MGSPMGAWKVVALKQQKRGQIKLLVGGVARGQALQLHDPAQSLQDAGRPWAPRHHSLPASQSEELGPSNGQGLAQD